MSPLPSETRTERTTAMKTGIIVAVVALAVPACRQGREEADVPAAKMPGSADVRPAQSDSTDIATTQSETWSS